MTREANSANTAEIRGGERWLTLKFKRNDVAVLMWALESVIEDAKYDGGLVNVPDEMRLLERLRIRLRQHDRGPAPRAERASRKDVGR